MNPSRSPFDPRRIQKIARIAHINELCDIREYNAMVASQISGGGKGGARHQSIGSIPLAAHRDAIKGAFGNIGRDSGLGGKGKGKHLEVERQLHRFLDANGGSGAAKESYSMFMQGMSIGLDMRLMTLAGAVVGYYVMYSRGLGSDMCVIGAAVGAVVMLFVDAILLLIRLGREDTAPVAPSSERATQSLKIKEGMDYSMVPLEKKRQ